MPPTQTQPQTNGVDPSIVNMAQAIRQQETGGAADAYVKPGASGEFGAYQFLPSTWNTLASKYGVNVPLQQADKSQQDAVAYNYLSDLKNKGFSPAQVAAAWNAGEAKAADGSWQTNVGTNSSGVSYNTPAYVSGVVNYYQQFKNGQNPSGASTNTAATTLPTYGATFPSSPNDTGLTAGFKALGNLPSSVYGFGSGIVNALLHPINTVENLGRAAIGGVEELTGQQGQDQNTAAWDNLAQAFKQRYGSLEALQNTATNDPFGFGTDVASILAGGAGLADRAALAAGTELGAADALGNATTRIAKTASAPVTGAVGKVGDMASSLLGSVNPDVVAAAGRTGVTLPASGYTDNALVRAIDTLGNTGLGSTMANARVEAAANRMEDVARNIVNSAGGTEDLTAAGQNIAKGLEKFESAYNKLNAENYKAIHDSVGDVAAQTARPAAALQDIIASKEAIADTTNLKFFKDKLAVLTGGKAEDELVANGGKLTKTEGKQYAPPTFETLKKMKTNIGQMIDRKFDDPFVKSNIVDLKRLYGSLSDAELDTLRATGKKDLVNQYLATKQLYQQGRTEIASQFGRTIQRLANNGQYSKIIDALIKPSTAIEDVPRILAVAGEQGAADIRTNLLNKIFEGARNPEGDFTPQGIDRQLKKFGEDRLSLILSPEQLQGVKDLGTVTKALGDALKQSKGSQTAFLGKSFAEMGAVGFGAAHILSGDLVGGLRYLGAAVGGEAASMFIASNTGQKLLRMAVEHGANLTAGTLAPNAQEVTDAPGVAAETTGSFEAAHEGKQAAAAASKEPIVAPGDVAEKPPASKEPVATPTETPVKDTGNTLSNLSQEARKYASAEDFVKAQELAYHGSPVPLKSFSNKKGGVFFTNSMEDASGFGGNPDHVYEGYLNFKNPLVVDAKGAKWDELDSKYGNSTREVVTNAKKEGYDGVVFKNIVDNIADTSGEGQETTISYAFNPKDAFLNESQLADLHAKAHETLSKEIESLYKTSAPAKEYVDTLAQKISDEVGGKPAFTDLKSRGRAMEKVINEYGGDTSKLTDTARNTIIAPDYESYQKAIAALKNEDGVLSVKEIKEGDDPAGYTGAIAKVQTPNGHVAEIQINTPEMIYAKEPEEVARNILGNEKYTQLQKSLGVEGGKGHALYEQIRTAPVGSPEKRALEEESKVYYNDIRRKAQGEFSGK